MPQPRRRAGGKAPEPATETPVDEAKEAAQETEVKEKRVRAPKEYKIVSEEMADLVNEFLETEEYSQGDEITGDLIAKLRADGKGMKWDGTDENPGIKYVAGIKSAIPLRTLLQKYEAEGEGKLDPDNAEAIVGAMKEGAGWTQLSARTGLSVPDVKAAVKDLLAEEDIDVDDGGRGYGKGESWRWVSAAELNASKAANKEAAGTEAEEDDDEEEDDEEQDEPAATPRRRARQNA